MSTIKYDQPYRLTQDEGGLRRGAIVYKLTRSDYGCANDDTRRTGVDHVSMTLKKDGDWPGASVPIHVLEPVPFKPHLTPFGEGYWTCGENTKNVHPVSIGPTPQIALAAWHAHLQWMAR